MPTSPRGSSTKICIKTYGCAHNQADSETMLSYLSDYSIVDSDYDLIPSISEFA